MAQHIFVYVIFAVCVVLVVWRIGRRFVSGNNGGDACAGCSADCKLRGLKKKDGTDCKK